MVILPLSTCLVNPHFIIGLIWLEPRLTRKPIWIRIVMKLNRQHNIDHSNPKKLIVEPRRRDSFGWHSSLSRDSISIHRMANMICIARNSSLLLESFGFPIQITWVVRENFPLSFVCMHRGLNFKENILSSTVTWSALEANSRDCRELRNFRFFECFSVSHWNPSAKFSKLTLKLETNKSFLLLLICFVTDFSFQFGNEVQRYY